MNMALNGSGVPAAGEIEALRLDFAPNLLALQERPPARLPRAVGTTVVTASALLMVWACFAKLDIVASAEGRLVPKSLVKVVQPAEGGVVTELLVKEGDRVAAGQVLVRLDARSSQADHQAFERDLWLKYLSLRRVEAELHGQQGLTIAGLVFDAKAGQTLLPAPSLQDRTWLDAMAAQVLAQFHARRSAQADALTQEQGALARAQAELAAAVQVQTKLSRTLPNYQQSAAAFQQLVKEGFVGELAANDKSREAIEREQDLRAQESTVHSLRASIDQSRSRLAALQSQYRAQLENERIELQAQVNKGAQDLQKSSLRDELLDVRATQSGIVKDLLVSTPGAVVQAGAVLMNVVPMGEPLVAEVMLKNEDAGFVAAGQTARLKIAAFPFQKYGMLDARVSLVAADALDPKQAAPGQAPNLTYRALVTPIDEGFTGSFGAEPLRLQPGMWVTAEIHQGERSVLEYLLSPVRKVAQEAARER
jgi:hemolysin D